MAPKNSNFCFNFPSNIDIENLSASPKQSTKIDLGTHKETNSSIQIETTFSFVLLEVGVYRSP